MSSDENLHSFEPKSPEHTRPGSSSTCGRPAKPTTSNKTSEAVSKETTRRHVRASQVVLCRILNKTGVTERQ